MATVKELIFDQDLQQLTRLDTAAALQVGSYRLNDTDVLWDVYAPADYGDWLTAAVNLVLAVPPGSMNRPTSGTVAFAVNEDKSSGSLIIGKRYIIDTLGSGADFTGVGGVNTAGTIFEATDTTPNWGTGSVLHAVLDDLNYNFTGAELATAINALAGDWAYSDVSGHGAAFGPFQVIGGALEDLPTFYVASNNLFPQTEFAFTTVQDGGGAAREIIDIQMRLRLLMDVSSATAITAGTAAITSVQVGSTGTATRDIQRLTVTSHPYRGGLSLRNGTSAQTNPFLPWTVSESDLETEIAALDGSWTDNVSVEQVKTGPVEYEWLIYFDESLGAVTALDVADELTYAVGRRFTGSLNTVNLNWLLANSASAQAVLELQTESSGTIDTQFSRTVTVLNDHKKPASLVSTSSARYLTDAQSIELLTVTDATGGAGNLDGLVRDAEDDGRLFAVLMSGGAYDGLHFYEFTVDATPPAESAPGIVHDDGGVGYYTKRI